MLMCLYLALFVAVWFIDFQKPKAASSDEKPRSLKTLARQPGFLVSIFLASISYGAMGGLMAAVPLEMKKEGYDFDDSTLAIQMHMLGMFLPSFISGDLVRKFGKLPVMTFGFLILLGGAFIFYASDSRTIFALGIAVEGIGWNISFVPATALLADNHKPSEQREVQALNEVIVLGSLAICLFTASYALDAFGWDLFVGFHAIYIFIGLAGSLIFWVWSSCRDHRALDSPTHSSDVSDIEVSGGLKKQTEFDIAIPEGDGLEQAEPNPRGVHPPFIGTIVVETSL